MVLFFYQIPYTILHGGKIMKKRVSLVNTLHCVGNTPLVRLSTFCDDLGCEILAKVESQNLGGSIKSRTASGMVYQAQKRGEIKEDTIIVEATSGNQGIGLSMVGAVLGLSVRIIMPENMSQERQLIMKSYGADVILTPAGDTIAQAIQHAMALAREMAAADPRVFWINQFSNPDNAEVHRRFTAQEILRQSPSPIDYFVSGIGTGGTITGIGEVLKGEYPHCQLVAVEPDQAAILQGKPVAHHHQQGIGDGIIPGILNREIIDEMMTVSDEEAMDTVVLLAQQEGLFSGISSGSNVWAARKLAEQTRRGSRIVTILPDGGDRYLSSDFYRSRMMYHPVAATPG